MKQTELAEYLINLKEPKMGNALEDHVSITNVPTSTVQNHPKLNSVVGQRRWNLKQTGSEPKEGEKKHRQDRQEPTTVWHLSTSDGYPVKAEWQNKSFPSRYPNELFVDPFLMRTCGGKKRTGELEEDDRDVARVVSDSKWVRRGWTVSRRRSSKGSQGLTVILGINSPFVGRLSGEKAEVSTVVHGGTLECADTPEEVEG
ncbi:hypothetical protein RUM44_007312 [Polyplax serrata]|uniref:Uncharacterized protein n=1 Tax=Polyplax serrata TaxID=468196 RepID=A0ABR1B0D7_POLSC